MKLLTKKISDDAKAQYDKGSSLEDQMIVGKFFTPWSNWTWYLMNMHEDENYCWGIVQGNALEMGSFLIQELKAVDGPFGLKIERDKYFKPINAHDMWEKLNNE